MSITQDLWNQFSKCIGSMHAAVLERRAEDMWHKLDARRMLNGVYGAKYLTFQIQKNMDQDPTLCGRNALSFTCDFQVDMRFHSWLGTFVRKKNRGSESWRANLVEY